MERCFHREIALLQQKNLKLSDLLPVISFQDVLKNSVLLNCMEKKTPRYILRIEHFAETVIYPSSKGECIFISPCNANSYQ